MDAEIVLSFMGEHLYYIVAVLCVACVVLFCMCLVMFFILHRHKWRMDRFFGTRSERRNIEAKLTELYNHFVHTNENYDALLSEVHEKHAFVLNEMNERFGVILTDSAEKYDGLLALIDDMNNRMSFCIQQVGVVRYNPFEHMGGDLSFAVALLDEQCNGVVLSTIHGRDSSYTYVKPIVRGESSYALSNEERRAIARAANQNKLVASYPD